jgi:hypothetical protein
MKLTTKQVMVSTAPIHPGRRVRPRARSVLAIGLVAVTAACSATDLLSDAGGGGGTVEPTFTSLYGDYLANCKQCHTPTALGRTPEIEKTLDFTSRSTALSTLKTGMATGLSGSQNDCNGVAFIATTPGKSLLVAVIDQPTRQAIDLSPHTGCDVDTISDATAKVGSQPSAAFVTALKTWITSGAMDN